MILPQKFLPAAQLLFSQEDCRLNILEAFKKAVTSQTVHLSNKSSYLKLLGIVCQKAPFTIVASFGPQR
jgi:hypothetical protein